MRVLCLLGLVALAALASAAPAPKVQSQEYISIADVVDAANSIKDIFDQVKDKIASGVVKGKKKETGSYFHLHNIPIITSPAEFMGKRHHTGIDHNSHSYSLSRAAIR